MIKKVTFRNGEKVIEMRSDGGKLLFIKTKKGYEHIHPVVLMIGPVSVHIMVCLDCLDCKKFLQFEGWTLQSNYV